MTIGLHAQKDELKNAEKAIKSGDFKGALTIIESLDSMEETMDEKYKAQYYFLKGEAYGTRNVKKAAEAYNKLTAFEKQIGKQKYTKEAEPKLNDLLSFISNFNKKRLKMCFYARLQSNLFRCVMRLVLYFLLLLQENSDVGGFVASVAFLNPVINDQATFPG
jgi:hypothetical protein